MIFSSGVVLLAILIIGMVLYAIFTGTDKHTATKVFDSFSLAILVPMILATLWVSFSRDNYKVFFLFTKVVNEFFIFTLGLLQFGTVGGEPKSHIVPR